MNIAAPMQGASALKPGKPGPCRSENIGIAISTSAMPRAMLLRQRVAQHRKSRESRSVPPIRNSQARGGLMKKALAERSVRISQMRERKRRQRQRAERNRQHHAVAAEKAQQRPQQ